ncbi:hypothetical protein GUJ93_ZPchr0010g7965 [Zizania palustris]|uniref:Uncharacterized protein n=1 Tax=Zizania palustris TaxID=103762 RepID=A0A8J5WFN1_ZIZPA|nr:hypothetical protein GUJ93_ZPchr0010g7965 [Zizania palustris]
MCGFLAAALEVFGVMLTTANAGFGSMHSIENLSSILNSVAGLVVDTVQIQQAWRNRRNTTGMGRRRYNLSQRRL